MYVRLLLILSLFSVSQLALANAESDKREAEINHAIEMLDRINYLPNMLPIILTNTDFIGLTREQVDELKLWRRENMKPMLAAMREINIKRIEIKQAALSPEVTSAQLQQMQSEIFDLHRKVTNYKLSCREHVMSSFTRENWSSFFMVLADHNIGVILPVMEAQ